MDSCRKLIHQLLADPDAGAHCCCRERRQTRADVARLRPAPFCEPFDWQTMGYVDYLQVVETPMDLGTINVCI